MTASQSDCIFCKIANGDIDVPFVHETATTVAFKDQSPLAAVHILVVPKRHVAGSNALTRDDDALLGDLMETARAVAARQGIDASGYRVVANVGPDAGQTVHHLHFHVLGGEPLGAFGSA